MSEAFERVIAEQQKEIDRLRKKYGDLLKQWGAQDERIEQLAVAIFRVLNWPENEQCRAALRDAITSMGFCPMCEARTCECDLD